MFGSAAAQDAAGSGASCVRAASEAGAEFVNGVTVAVVFSRVEAELIVGMLRAHGLRAVLTADDAGGQQPQLQMDGVRVVVAASDEALARQLISADA